MTRRWLFLAACVLAAAGAVWVFAAGPRGDRTTSLADPDERELVALGYDVYAQACASCHGAALEGEQNWRVRKPGGRLPAPPHDATGHTWHHDDWTLFGITKLGPAGFSGTNYQSDMPGFVDVLDDREIWAVLAYIKSTWPAEIQARQAQITRQAEGQQR